MQTGHNRTAASASRLSPERAAILELNQLRVAERSVQPSAFAMPAFALVFSVVLAAWVPASELALWFLAVCVTSSRFFAAAMFLSQENLKPDAVRHWHNGLTAATFISHFVWMYPQIFFYARLTETGHMLVALVAGCSLAAGAAMLAPSPRLVWAPILVYGLALVVPPLVHGGFMYYCVAIGGTGLVMFMAHVARTLHASARDLILEREDKDDLIEQLAAAKFEAERARQRAESASHAKSEFLANMSHELRTPLNAIIGFSDIMKGEVFGPLGSAQYSEYMEHIHDSGRHLLGLINDILDLAKIEAGRFTVVPVQIDVGDLTQQTLRMFEVRAAQRRVDLRRDIDPGLPLFLADERGARQMLLNLIANAVNCTREGGTITVFARRTPSGGMDLGVSDMGPGIDPSDVPAVFEAFGPGRHDIASDDKGASLGLAIVRGLVEAHGGKVRLDSQLGKGTTVTCAFPRECLIAPQPAPVRLAAVI